MAFELLTHISPSCMVRAGDALLGIEVRKDKPLRRAYTVDLGKINETLTLRPGFMLASKLSKIPGVVNPILGGGPQPEGRFILIIVLSVEKTDDWERVEPQVKQLIEEGFSPIALPDK